MCACLRRQCVAALKAARDYLELSGWKKGKNRNMKHVEMAAACFPSEPELGCCDIQKANTNLNV